MSSDNQAQAGSIEIEINDLGTTESRAPAANSSCSGPGCGGPSCNSDASAFDQD